MKFTVFGATGFIGSSLSVYLKNEGHDVFCPEKHDKGIYGKNLGHVIYCIGLTADFRTKPFETVNAHVSLLAEMLENVDFDSFLYLSSTRVYSRSLLGEKQSLLTVDVMDPSDLYNLTKLTGESLCFSSGRPKVKVVRLSNVIGSDLDSNNFLISLIRDAVNGKILLKSDLKCSKDYVLLNDVVKLLPNIAVNGNEKIYNLASGINLSHFEIINKLKKITRCEVKVIDNAPVLIFPNINIDDIKSEFNFKPILVIDNIDKLVSNFRKHIDNLVGE